MDARGCRLSSRLNTCLLYQVISVTHCQMFSFSQWIELKSCACIFLLLIFIELYIFLCSSSSLSPPPPSLHSRSPCSQFTQKIFSFYTFCFPCRLYLRKSLLASMFLSKFSGIVVCRLAFFALFLKPPMSEYMWYSLPVSSCVWVYYSGFLFSWVVWFCFVCWLCGSCGLLPSQPAQSKCSMVWD